MTTRDHEIRLADGRILQTQDSGAADGQPAFLFHDGLGSRLVPDPLAVVATHAGLRLLSHDRPGLAAPQPSRAGGSPMRPSTSPPSPTSWASTASPSGATQAAARSR